MTCSCSTRITARILNATPRTFRTLHMAKLIGWTSLTDSRIDPVSYEQVDLVLTGFGDRARIERGLRELVPNAVEVRES